jgi:cytochrome c553
MKRRKRAEKQKKTKKQREHNSFMHCTMEAYNSSLQDEVCLSLHAYWRQERKRASAARTRAESLLLRSGRRIYKGERERERGSALAYVHRRT